MRSATSIDLIFITSRIKHHSVGFQSDKPKAAAPHCDVFYVGQKIISVFKYNNCIMSMQLRYFSHCRKQKKQHHSE